MKVRYTGDMRLAIETKLDLRETGAWSTFDRLLNVLHGHKAGDGMADMEALDPGENDGAPVLAWMGTQQRPHRQCLPPAPRHPGSLAHSFGAVPFAIP